MRFIATEVTKASKHNKAQQPVFCRTELFAIVFVTKVYHYANVGNQANRRSLFRNSEQISKPKMKSKRAHKKTKKTTSEVVLQDFSTLLLGGRGVLETAAKRWPWKAARRYHVTESEAITSRWESLSSAPSILSCFFSGVYLDFLKVVCLSPWLHPQGMPRSRQIAWVSS